MEGTLFAGENLRRLFGEFRHSTQFNPRWRGSFLSAILFRTIAILPNISDKVIYGWREDFTGTLLWQRTIGLSALDNGRAIIYDPVSGNVYGLGLNYAPNRIATQLYLGHLFY